MLTSLNNWFKDKWWEFKTRNDWKVSKIACPDWPKCECMLPVRSNRHGFFYADVYCIDCRTYLPAGPIKGMKTR